MIPNPHPILGHLRYDEMAEEIESPIDLLFQSTFYHGQCAINFKTGGCRCLQILSVVAIIPAGSGRFHDFVEALKNHFEEIMMLHVWNQLLAVSLRHKHGFLSPTPQSEHLIWKISELAKNQ